METRIYYDRKKKEWQVVSMNGLAAAWGDTKEEAQEEFDHLMERVGDTMDWCEPNEDFCEEIGDEDYDEIIKSGYCNPD